MKRLTIGFACCIAAMSAFTASSQAGYVDTTGKHRSVAEFRADAQACANTWSAEHPHRVAIRPRPVVRTVARPAIRATARYNFILYTCLPSYGWRPTAS